MSDSATPPVPDAGTPEVPDDVQQAARDHNLGPLTDVRKLTRPMVVAAGYLAAAVGAGLLFLLLSWIATSTDDFLPRSLGKLLALGALCLLVFGIGFLIAALVALLRGERSFYLWDGGFVYRHNSRVRAYTWEDIAQVTVQRIEAGENAGQIYRYQVVPGSGQPINVPVELTDGHDPFNESLAEAARAAGRPVV
ncbi:hypothetical protein LWF15_01070 [Kineosporia rhizophila]|uniref:DUF6585 family protein n=1 Tax=Kineosporia TaxID=49184 RepID=UPI001E332188|nr:MULTISPECIES: DUF6585 family protein [Kineosporia]MCE0534096.1 hypothetical protein [Kineosporia rhizophila]GLY13644.1 hypothetical protein Kisp01_06600 [Kineosporia sp. NBRC 101677]